MMLLKRYASRATTLTAVAVLGGSALVGVAMADIIGNDVPTIDTNTKVMSLAANGATGSTTYFVTPAGGDGKPGCNLTSSTTLTVSVGSSDTSVATVSPSSLTFTGCGATPTVTVTPHAAGSSTVRLTQTANTTDGTFDLAPATFTVNVAAPVPTNTKPTVEVTGVDQLTYEIGQEPTVGCAVTDTEDGNSTETPEIDRTALVNGMGVVTVTCDAEDSEGLAADTATATYTLVDTTDPLIGHTLNPSSPNGDNGWYTTDVDVTFNCSDTPGSGIASCVGDRTLKEGEDQEVTGTATDNAGNTATDTASNIDIDETKPTVNLTGGPASQIYFGDDVTAPHCDASDDLSGLDEDGCVVTGGGATLGEHSYTATATDMAGNTQTATLTYTVLAWTPKGFYQPVDMNGVLNTVKAGSTVPLKFELFAGSTEKTATSAVKSFSVKGITCPGASAPSDDIELVTTGGTSLRYDATGGQFIQNWATPKKPGTCYTVTMTAQEETSSISADFKLK